MFRILCRRLKYPIVDVFRTNPFPISREKYVSIVLHAQNPNLKHPNRQGTLVLPSKKGKTKKYWKSFRYPDQANYRLFG
jgi:hypothetical protein